MAKLTEHWCPIWQFSEVQEPKTDKDWMAQVFRYALSMHWLLTFNKFITNGLIFLSASYTSSSRGVHAAHQPQFGHVYYIDRTLEINDVTLHEAELSRVGVLVLCTDSNQVMQMTFLYTIYCIQGTFFCSSSCENTSMHGSSLKWEILEGRREVSHSHMWVGSVSWYECLGQWAKSNVKWGYCATQGQN
jgi:hypothetical protein